MKIKEIEKLVKNETKNVASVVHNFSHLRRTARGAKWFVEILGDNKKEQKLAYIAGLFHDIVRPASEKICHAKSSAKKSREILREFKLNKADLEKIILAIKDHREKSKWKSPLNASVFLADKILEQMGAFIVFRRCMYVGECGDYKNISFRKAIIRHFEERLTKFNPNEFPKKILKLVNYQYSWPEKFLKMFENDKKWTIEIAKSFYKYGRKKMNLERVIKQFKPKYRDGKRYKKEALEYIKGEKFKFFSKLIK